MKYDEKLVEKLCREMGIEYHPEQDGVMIAGKKLPDDFSAEKLFRGEYDDRDEV